MKGEHDLLPQVPPKRLHFATYAEFGGWDLHCVGGWYLVEEARKASIERDIMGL